MAGQPIAVRVDARHLAELEMYSPTLKVLGLAVGNRSLRAGLTRRAPVWLKALECHLTNNKSALYPEGPDTL